MKAETIKKILFIICALICGGVFVFSAITKLYPIEPFEVSMVDIGLANWKLSPFVARLFIGAEFITGFFLITLFRLRRLTIPFAAFLLLAFTIYLGLLIVNYGNTGDCGCFGDFVKITPWQGILKNAGLLMLLGGAYMLQSKFEFRFKTLLVILGAVVLLILPFILNPVGNPFSNKTLSNFERFSLDTATLYPDSMNVQQDVDARKRKHIVAFLSVTCKHCRIAAKKLAVMKKKDPTVPVFFVLFNNKKKLQDFFDDTRSGEVPHMLIDSSFTFLKLTQGSFPRIYWVNNSVVEYETNYFELDPGEVNTWLGLKDTIKGP